MSPIKSFAKREFKSVFTLAFMHSFTLIFSYWFLFFLVPFCARFLTGHQASLKVVIIGVSVSTGFAALSELCTPRFRKFLMIALGATLFFGGSAASLLTISIASEASQFTIFSILDTSGSEALEFIHVFLNFKAFMAILFLTVPFIVLYFKRDCFSYSRSIARFLIFTFIFLSPYPLKAIQNWHTNFMWASLDYPSHLYIPAQPYTALADALEYKKMLATFNSQREVPEVTKSDKMTPETIVVMVGESLTRHRMSIYDYCRNTTPYLKKHKDEFIILNDVISRYPNTVPSVQAMLTPNSKARYTIIDAFQSANVPVWWISNQPQVGAFESEISLLTESAENRIWVNPNGSGALMEVVPSYDEFLLPALDKALAEKGNKVVFLHMIGSHFAYDKRYPAGFAASNKLSKFPSSVSSLVRSQAHAYDLSVLYTDKVIGQVTEKLRGKDAALIMFSDHGDEVYQFTNFVGHGGNRLTPGMTDVPFVVWLSDKAKLKGINVEGIKQAVDKPLSLDGLFYMLAELGGLEIPDFDDKQNPFSESFIPVVRKVRKIDYKTIKQSHTLYRPEYWCSKD